MKAEVVIVEVGGTVGDIESLPFLEALRQMRKDVGRENTLYIHVTWLPHIGATGELKTKPTQHSVRELRGIGIQPDVIIARSDYAVDDSLRDKIALFCDVELRAVIPMVTTPLLYELPLLVQDAGLGDIVLERLGLEVGAPDLQEWRALVAEIKRPKPSLRIALVGKYVQLQDAYLSVREALHHAGVACGRDVEVVWINSEEMQKGRADEQLQGVSGVVVPGGFGYRGIEGKIRAAQYAREHGVPYLGLCLGMQMMVVEFARSVAGLEGANSTEFDTQTPHPVIDLLPEQRQVFHKGGTMRLGSYPCHLVPGTRAAQAYGQEVAYERHRHRFEFNNTYRRTLTSKGLVTSGLLEEGDLVEIVELEHHPWMVATQFHPEFKSRPNKPHPLFRAFLSAVMKRGEERVAVMEEEASVP
jgi:CTP synthase